MSQENAKTNSSYIRRRHLFKMVSVGVVDDRVNQMYDVISTTALLLNLVGAFASTYDSIQTRFGSLLSTIEAVTVFFFAVDYVLRFYTADFLYPDDTRKMAMWKYASSFDGIVDILSFLPYYLPFFFPAGASAFRLFRVVRILRLFRINAYYDSLNVITEVMTSKKQLLISSVFIIFVLMLASSLCMYSLEHDAQPEVFQNAFSGIWWSFSTLLTVGYGDIYPVTTLGRLFSIIITFLGVGMVAIPTGIISAGFVEQYSRLKRIGDVAMEEDIHFISLRLDRRDAWTGKTIREIKMPRGAIVAVINRGNETIVPRGDVVLKAEDRIVIGAEPLKNDKPIHLTEITIRKNNPWNGSMIKDLDISRLSFIIAVKRHGKMLVPNGDMILLENDIVIMYSKTKVKVVEDE